MGISGVERRLDSRSSCLPTHQITCEPLRRSDITRQKKQIQSRKSENWDFKRVFVLKTSAGSDRKTTRCASLNVLLSSSLAIRSHRKSRCVSSGLDPSGSGFDPKPTRQLSPSADHGDGSLVFDGAGDRFSETIPPTPISASEESSSDEETSPSVDRDGNSSDTASFPSTPSSLQSAKSLRSRPTFRGIDLTLPTHAALPDPSTPIVDTPTPLTQASPARGAFPFPQQDWHVTSLSPLSLRRQAHGIRSSHIADSRGSPSRQRSGSATPDRFIPIRSNSARETLQLNKPPHLLSADEKISRKRSLGHDPFSRHTRATSRLQRGPRVAPGAHSVTGPRTYALAPNNVFSLQRGSPVIPTTPRQASAGAVWNIGGSAALGDSVTAVSDGRGGLLGSGTNAPLYTPNFFQRADPTSELDVHEKRLALALDINQASRILEVSVWSGLTSSPFDSPASSSLKGPLPEVRGATIWRDSEWVKDGSTTSSLFGP